MQITYLESLSFIIISRFIYQPQSCENHKTQVSKLSSSCRFISIFQKGTTLLKMLQDFTFPDFDEIVTNILLPIYAAIASIAFSFFRKGGITENQRPTLYNKEKTNKQSKNNNTQKQNRKKNYISTREDKGDREGILHTHPIP